MKKMKINYDKLFDISDRIGWKSKKKHNHRWSKPFTGFGKFSPGVPFPAEHKMATCKCGAFKVFDTYIKKELVFPDRLDDNTSNFWDIVLIINRTTDYIKYLEERILKLENGE
jgi:hypothetical protein